VLLFAFPPPCRRAGRVATSRICERTRASASAGALFLLGSAESEPQICSYPLVTSLADAYAVVGAPVYDLPLGRPGRIAASQSSRPIRPMRRSKICAERVSRLTIRIRIPV
jgi:hypothetical protein